MAFRKLARVDDVPDGRGLCVRVGRLEIGLFRFEGEIHALENRCPHAGHPLSEGRMRGPAIVCPAHGWDFDVRTGFKPADPDGFPIPRFAVRVEGDAVWVDLDAPINLRRRRRAAGPEGDPDGGPG